VKTLWQNFLGLSFGSRVVITLYALGYPLAQAGHYTRSFELYDWLALCPALVWKGEVWTLLTYAFLPGGIIDYVVSLFWLATLISVLGRNWSTPQVLGFCALTIVSAALLLCALQPKMQFGIAGNAALILGLLVAWYRLYGRERIILLGLGELSVRQVAILVGIIELLILFFSVPLVVSACMLFGGLVGWVYLAVAGKRALSRPSQVVDSERIARLEL